MNKAVLAIAFGLMLSVSTMATLATAGSVGHGDFGVYKGGQLADKLSGQNPIDEGALLVCDGKCMIKSEGVSLVAADQAKLAIRNEAKTFNLFLREGNVNYTITSNARQVAFHTPQGTYTTAEVIFNAAANPVVRIAIGTVAALIAMGGVVWSRVRAHKVDLEARLEHEMQLVEELDAAHEQPTSQQVQTDQQQADEDVQQVR